MNRQLKARTGWLKLSLLFFATLILIIFVSVGLFYPKIQRYIDYSVDLKAQPLTAVARNNLLDAFAVVIDAPLSAAQTQRVVEHLDISYGLINLNLYLKKYPCTSTALQDLDLITELVTQGEAIDLKLFAETMLPILRCMAVIQNGQDMAHSEMATSMASDFSYSRNFMFWSGLLAFVAGLGFLLLHVKQSRIIERSNNETHKLISQATHDALTGALNRRAFDADLPGYLEQYSEKEQPFSVLLCDIDYFKQYNDQLGHLEGDEALKHVTQALGSVLREHDKLYRYGGEELIIILESIDRMQAQYVGERVLEQVRKLRLPHPTSEHRWLTISIGCATVNEVSDPDVGLIQLADQRLYAAKQRGRNCMVYGSETG